MTVREWQIALRRQYGREARFGLRNIGEHPVFSDFQVSNPERGTTYRVAIRGVDPRDNFCSCPDYAVNTLGTCKHIEFVLAKFERSPRSRSALARGYRQPYSEVYVRYGVRREVAFKPGVSCPPELKALAARYFDGRAVLKPAGAGHFDQFVKAVRGIPHEVRVYDDALMCMAQIRDKAGLVASVEATFPEGTSSPAFEKLLKVPLYPYQREGALFAAKAGRCLIADEMGLGKTLQALAATEILARVAGVERVLIVAPTSLKRQWKEEVLRFTDRTVEVIEGLLAGRAAAYARPTFFKITNYDVVQRDLPTIREWAPDLVIIDEAQRIKNWKTRTAQSIKQLPSTHAIVLTGTPLENRLEELHSIVEFVDRFHLGPRFAFLADHQRVDEHARVIGYRNLSKVADTLKPILIRRTKDQVLRELPARLHKRLFLPMTAEQWRHHEENRAIVARIVARWRRSGFLSEQDQRILMIALQNMRMACNSTYLLDPKTDSGFKADELISLLGEVLEEPQAKLVVFSQWVRTQDLLVKRLKARRLPFVRFHGGMPGQARHAAVRTFKDHPRYRVFLSTDAGGVGLNLQEATAVVNMDLPWNPAVLEQRIGRVHRLGQDRPVQVYDLISERTIEHGMLELLTFKHALFAGVLDGGQDEVFLGGTRLTRFMESVERATSGRHDGELSRKSAPDKSQPGRPDVRHVKGDREQDAKEAAEAMLGSVIAAGRSLLNGLEESLIGHCSAGGVRTGQDKGQGMRWDACVERDEESGRASVKLPLPGPEALRKIADFLASLDLGKRSQ